MSTTDYMLEPKRSRNAQATRDALLESAGRLFSTRAYEAVGLRDVAGGAGVNVSLVARYFGSKEALFAAVVEACFHSEFWTQDTEGLHRRLADYVAGKSPPPPSGVDPLMLMLRSAHHPEAAAVLQRALDEQVIAPLASRLDGAEATERAALVTALVTGVSVLRLVLRSTALAGPAEPLADRLAPLIESLIAPATP